MENESLRNRLIDTATSSFTKGVIDQLDFEILVTRINATSSPAELELIAGELPQIFGGLVVRPASLPPAPLWRDLNINMGNIKKTGEWVDADAYSLQGRMSNYELDFRSYEGINGFRLALDVELDMSNLKLIVPDGWVISCNLENNVASNVKDKRPSAVWGDNLIAISGTLRMSNIKVKYK